MTFRLIPRSLKYRLLLAFLVGMVLIQAGASYLAYRLMERHTWEEFDRTLADKIEFLRTTFFFDDQGRPKWRMGEADWDRYLDKEDPDYFQFQFPDGRYIRRSKNLDGKPLPAVGQMAEIPEFTNVQLPHGSAGRAAGMLAKVKHYLTADFKGDSEPELVHIVIARSVLTVEKTLSEVRWRLLAASALGTLALMGAAFFIIRQNVKSAGELAEQIAQMPLDDAGRRFALPKAPEELDKVVGRLNALMDRVATAIENERQFTSNAAHELRTPLAGMRSTIEVALSRTRSTEEYENTLFQLKDMQWKLQRLAENLLLLARLDSGQKEFGQEQTTLKAFLRRVWKPYFDPAMDKELNVSWKIEESGAMLNLPGMLLEIVVGNLYQNAVDYSPRGSRIEVMGTVVGTRCELRIANPNPGLSREELNLMFQRFWRADKSGDPNVTSAGIGLALCKRIMEVLQGSISAELTEDQQLALHCSFPVTA
jgi:two-component system, OmpR family, heavy metal sensor histidine kinase CusS